MIGAISMDLMDHATPGLKTSKVSGHVCSEKGAMLQDARITCGGIETRTLADGFFTLNNLPAGSYEIKASLQRFKTMSKKVLIQKGEEATVDFRLSSSIGNAKICGHVYDAESKKIIGREGSVTLILPVANRYRHVGNDGYFEFENLPAGQYKIFAAIPDYKEGEALIEVAEGETKVHDFLCTARKVEEPSWG